jgi:hypothetical protein
MNLTTIPNRCLLGQTNLSKKLETGGLNLYIAGSLIKDKIT